MTYRPHNAELERQRKHYAAVKARLWAGAVPRPIPFVKLPPSQPKPVKRDWLWLFSKDVRPAWPPYRAEDKSPRLEDVIRAVCKAFGVSREALISARRGNGICEARHVYYWASHTYTGASYPQIAGHCGARNHTTAINGVRRVEARLNHFAPMIEKVKSELGITELTAVADHGTYDLATSAETG